MVSVSLDDVLRETLPFFVMVLAGTQDEV